MADAFGLTRFVEAQDRDGTYARAVAELRAGRKQTHWMWFVFPQIAGLGHSAMARAYAVASLAEGVAYAEHPTLGPRLVECANIVAGITGRSAVEIFGPIDAVKLRSSMTLFARAAPGEPAFGRVLGRYFDGAEDPETVSRLCPSEAGPPA